MLDDFDDHNKAEILNSIQDPHQKDIANFTLTTKDLAFAAIIGGFYPSYLAWCAYLLTEVGDHAAAMLCYTVCSGFIGIASYTAFIKIWQNYSIPAKNYLVRITLSIVGNKKVNFDPKIIGRILFFKNKVIG
jgi:hypothetical protein